MNATENLRHDENEQLATTEIQLTNEQLETQILAEVMERYGVDMNEYVKDSSRLDLTVLMNEINDGGNIDEIKNRESENLYREFSLEYIERYGIVPDVTADIDSPRLNDKKEVFEKLIDDNFGKYEFLPKNSKENLKMALINSSLNGPIGENINATLGSFIQTFGSIDNLIQRIIKGDIIENENPVVTGRIEAFKELWENLIKPYKEKFDKINDFFQLEENVNIPPEQQQIIIGNIDWFRNPSLIESGVGELDIEQINLNGIDLNNLEPKELTEDERNNLIEYSMKTRENLVELAKKLETGNVAAEFIYNIINKPGLIGEKARGLMEMLLKIPFLGEWIGTFLGLNSNNPIEELNENSRNIKLFNNIKGLGETKGENGEIKEGKGIFKHKDLKSINFNSLKNEIKEIINLEGISIDSDKYKEFCEKAFSQQGFEGENGIKLKFSLRDTQETKSSLNNVDMKDILRRGVNEYKEGRRSIPQIIEENQVQQNVNTEATETPINVTIETEELQPTQINTEDESVETQNIELVDETINNKIKQNAIDLLSGKMIEGLTNTLLLGDYNDFKKIKLIDIENNSNLNSLLRNNIGRSDYNNLPTEVKDSLFLAISIVKDFLNENRSFQTYQDWAGGGGKELLINDIIYHNNEFKEYLSKK